GPYHLRMWRGISLANKCLLLFGAAVVLIIVAALTVPWMRMNAIVEEDQREISRRLVEWWQRDNADVVRRAVGAARDEVEVVSGDGTLRIVPLPLVEMSDGAAAGDEGEAREGRGGGAEGFAARAAAA